MVTMAEKMFLIRATYEPSYLMANLERLERRQRIIANVRAGRKWDA